MGDTIVRLCPQEKLTACYQEYGGQKSTVDNALTTLVSGIFLNIDNSMLNACQTAAQTKFLEICGDLNDCITIPTENTVIGTESLAALRDGKITTIKGLVNFGKIGMKEVDVSEDFPDVKYYNIDLAAYNECPGTNDIKVLSGIQTTIKRKFEVLLTDPTVSMCVMGRDLRQITGGKGRKKKSDARFPHLLDSYAAVIVDSAVRAAQTNYNNRYTELLVDAEETAKSEAEDYKNQIACNRMALTDDFDNITMSKNVKAGVTVEQCQVKIETTAGREELLEAMKQKNHTERVLTAKISSALKEVKKKIDKKKMIEDSEVMIGKVDVNAVYEPGPKVCRITTTTYSCQSMAAVSDSKSAGVDLGASVPVGGMVSVGGNVGFSYSMSSYRGSVCSSFSEPIISEQLINMSSGEVVAGDITRSNLTTKIEDNSVVDNSHDFSLGGLGLDLGGISGGGKKDKASKNKSSKKKNK